MKIKEILHSHEDKSVNFVFDNWLEARFVRRTNDYFIVYLSSHDGCNKACRFCHLTQTGQTSFNETSLEEYLIQARAVLDYYLTVRDTQGHALRVNFNFMARGEPLANSVILDNAASLFQELENLAHEANLKAIFNISTIFPTELENRDLTRIFANVTQEYGIYYSLYSVDPHFRKRWLPKALNYHSALEKLQAWQEKTQGNLAFHWAFIKGENDSEKTLQDLINEVAPYRLKAKYNLVRYNPFSPAQGEEPCEEILQNNFNMLNNFFKSEVSRIVPRVGYDVKASCGMFVFPEEKAL